MSKFLSLFSMKIWNKMRPPLLASTVLLLLLLNVLIKLAEILHADLTLLIDWNIVNIGRISVSVPLLFDKVSLSFSAVVLTISFRVMLFSASYISGDKNLEYFIIMVLIFILSMNLLIFSPRIVSLLLGWDGLGLSSYLLVIYYANGKSLAAGMVTAITNRVGDALLILAVRWGYVAGQWMMFFSSFSVIYFVGLRIVIAAITKRAQLPFSAWLPAAIAAPTPVSALVHSSTLVTAGIYLIIRFYPSLSLFIWFKRFCFVIGVLTCLIARSSAYLEVDLKKIIALSTLSQLGVIILSLGIGYPTLTYFHLVTHALFKALLFICAGNIIHRINNNQDIRIIGYLTNCIPLTVTVLNIANISLCGLPFLAGFYSKDLIVEMFIFNNLSIISRGLIIIRVCITSLYRIKLSIYTLWLPYNGNSMSIISDQSYLSRISYTVLAAGAIIRGSFFSWALTPTINLTVLPLSLKLLALMLIRIFGVLALIIINKKFVFLHWFSSIWFLRFLTAQPLINTISNFSFVFNYNEMTWMERIRGKGLARILNINSPKVQLTRNISLSTILSRLITITVFILIIIY